MVNFYLLSGNVSHLVKVSRTIAISLLFIAFGELAVGHESGYTSTRSSTPIMLPVTNIVVGNNAIYTSLTGAKGLFFYMNLGMYSGDVVATITSDLNETGEVSLNATFNGSLKIQSDGTTNTISGITTIIGAPLININGTDKVTFDGGAGKLLTFKNYTDIASINTGPVIKFSNGSSSCLVTNCNFESNTLNPNGVILIGTGTNSVTISNNEIRDVPGVTGFPYAAINSSSVTNSINITNNNIYNWRNYGVYLANVGNGCIISGNSFYMESGVTSSVSQTAIHINGSNNHFISNNFIGGQSANCGGGVWTNTGNIDIKGIYLTNSISSTSTIQGNTIQNITLSGTGSLYGIHNNNGLVIVKKNKIFNLGALSSTAKIYGVFNNQAADENEFSNNMIAIGSGSGAIYGFYDVSLVGSTEFYYNSINIFGTGSAYSSYAFNRAGTAPYIFKDNILSNVRTGSGNHYAIFGTSTSAFTSNYNDFYVIGPVLANWGGSYKANLAAWSYGTEMDEHSVSVLPKFASNLDLKITTNAAISNHGTPISSVTDDIDGFSRNELPGMGINQFGPLIKYLTIKGINADKDYDGTTKATFDFRNVVQEGKDVGDDVTLTGLTGTFSDKNAGKDKTITITGYTLGGTNASKYILSQSPVTATITGKVLTINTTSVSRVYDGTTSASVSLFDNRLQGDNLIPTYTSATFNSKNVGANKPITVNGISFTGVDALNYIYNTTASTSASITPKELIVSATSAPKVYDGTTSATITLSDNRSLGDILTTSYVSAAFNNMNVGIGVPITVYGISIIGSDALNYTYNTTASISSTITKKELTVSASGVSKVYDGTTSATITLSDNRSQGDNITTSYTSAAYDNKQVGTGKTVAVNGISITGADAFNYTLNTTATTSSDISKKPLIVSVTSVPKVYDGTTSAIISLSDNRATGDNLTTSYTSAAYDNKNVGTGKTVTVKGVTIAGTDASNYTYNTTSNVSSTITPMGLIVTAIGVTKVYDGTTSARVTLSDNRLQGDILTTSYMSTAFDTKYAGTSKSVTIKGISIAGADAGNYTYNATATASSTITKKGLIIIATGVPKIYNGTNSANVILSDNRLQGDYFASTYTSATFDNMNIGAGKPITVNGISISGTDAGNYSYNTTASASSSIAEKGLIASVIGVTKVYDGTTAITFNIGSVVLSGKSNGDDVTLTALSGIVADKNVGSDKSVTITSYTLGGKDAGKYIISPSFITATITNKALTVSTNGFVKVYDGTTSAIVNLFDDHIPGDNLTTSYSTASFDNKNVGTNKIITVNGISIAGTDILNYTFNNTANISSAITEKGLIISITCAPKIYDGTTSASVVLSDNRLSGDIFTLTYASAAFINKAVGTGITVIASGISIAGSDALNYTYNTSASTSSNITPMGLIVYATGLPKVYNGTTSATVNLSDNRQQGDNLTTSYSNATFDNKNVGTNKPITVDGISISGADVLNYTYNTTANASADITEMSLIVSATGASKVYDAKNSATVTLSDNRPQGDNLTTSYSNATFDNKNVGTNKPIAVDGISITGTDASNYTHNTTASTTSDITEKGLLVSATGIPKIYNGTTSASVNLSDDRLSGDIFTSSYSNAKFDNKKVGTNKPISVEGITITGTDALNYTHNSTTSTSSTITEMDLLISATGIPKVYDATTSASVNISDNRVQGDSLTISYSVAFDNKNVGTNKPVTINGISISGADALNYLNNTSTSTSSTITEMELIVSATCLSKVYDGTTSASVTLSDNRQQGDTLNTSYTTALFDNKNADPNKIVTVDGISISGTDALNYTYNSTAIASSVITKKQLIVTATCSNKVYDGTTAATVSFSDNRLQGDTLTPSYSTATFDNKNIGTGKPVTVNGIILTGADAINYISNTTASTSATITKMRLIISASGVSKFYDGTTLAPINLIDNRPQGDNISTHYTTSTFENKYAGTNKPVTVNGISITGADILNYTYNTTTSTNSNIVKKVLTVSASGISKVYDGTTSATVNLSDDRLQGDILSTSYTTAAFDNKNIGTNKSVLVIGISITGSDALNYTFNPTANTTATIMSVGLTLTMTGVTVNMKVYDGTTSAVFNINSAVLIGKDLGDNVSLTGLTGTFADKNAGAGKNVTITSYTLGGTNANKYILAESSLTATIIGKALMISATSLPKVYDASPSATVTLSDKRLQGDDLTIAYTTAEFDSKNVGTNKPVTIKGISVTGSDALNYIYSTTAYASPNNISFGVPLILTGVTAESKVYDGTISATLNTNVAKISGVISPDLVTLKSSVITADFDDMNVGTGKLVTPKGFIIGGIDAANYTMVIPALTSSITTKPLTITPNSISKCIGTAQTFLDNEFTSVGLEGNDKVTSVTLTSNGSPATATTGTYDIVANNAVGTGLSNYSVQYVNGTMTVNTSANQPANFTFFDASVCAGTGGITYRVPLDPLVTYNWSYSGTGVTINGTTNDVILNFSAAATSGTLSVIASTACTNSSARSLAITVNQAQTKPVITIDPQSQVILTSDATTGNHWFDINGLIIGATAQTYTATHNGIYYVSITGNCTTVQSNTINVTHVSIPEFEKPTISLYPNPNTGEFWVNFKAAGNEKLKMIQVYNKLGKAIYHAIPSSISNDLSEWVSIKNQSVGIYILVLTTDNQRISRQIVITK